MRAEGLAEQLFGSHLQANMLLIGAAYQHGCLPLSADAIERAIELNGAAVETNIAAFRWGRVAVARPGLVPVAVADPDGPGVSGDLTTGVRDRGETLADWSLGTSLSSSPTRTSDTRSTTSRTCSGWPPQSRTGSARAALRSATAYADGLFKLMAYKDEYEVARLHLDLIERARLHAEFGGDARVKVLLHPPLLRALGMKRKLALGRSAMPLFRALQASRRLRGTSV